MDILNDILQQSLLKFLWIGSFAGIFVGIGMLFKPQHVILLNQYFTRCVGNTDKLAKLIDRPHWIERFMYRHHGWVGSGILVGSLAILNTFLFSFNLRKVSSTIPPDYWWLSDALVGMLIVGGVLSALIGIIVLVKPSLLRDVEVVSNRWISTDRMLTLFNDMHYSADRSLFNHRRLSGLLITCGSCYVVIVLGYFLFRQVT